MITFLSDISAVLKLGYYNKEGKNNKKITIPKQKKNPKSYS